MINMDVFNSWTYLDIIFTNKYEGGAPIRAGAAIRRYTVIVTVMLLISSQ